MGDLNQIYQKRFEDAPWLKKQRILIGGAGGIGSPLVFQLAKLGHEVYVYDFDIYEDVNVGPQLAGPKHLGQPKATVLAQIASEFSGNTHINGIVGPYDETTGAFPISIAAFDNMEARKLMAQSWYKLYKSDKNRKKTPYAFIDGGMYAEQGIIKTVTDKKTYDRWMDEYQPSEKMPDGECTFRSTIHNSFITSGYIVAMMNNVIANTLVEEEDRFIPYRFMYELEMLTTAIN